MHAWAWKLRDLQFVRATASVFFNVFLIDWGQIAAICNVVNRGTFITFIVDI